MGNHVILCYDLDLTLSLVNLYLIQVETLAGQVGEHFDASFTQFRASMRALKQAERSIQLNDRVTCIKAIKQSIDLIKESEASAGSIVESVQEILRILDHPPNQEEFLVRREALFPALQYDALHAQLLKSNAVSDARLWDPIVRAFQQG